VHVIYYDYGTVYETGKCKLICI